MEQNNEPEALDVANQLENGFITLGKTARALRYEAAETIRHLHARNQELEAMLEAVGAGGVSAQRVTKGKDHFAQDCKMVAAQKTNGLLARIEKEISTAQINNHRMAAPFGKMEGEPCVRISSLLATIEGFLNEASDEQAPAPVVLPEPGINTASHAGFRVIGYTEQQVRELLAANGITQKKRSNDKEEQQWQ